MRIGFVDYRNVSNRYPWETECGRGESHGHAVVVVGRYDRVWLRLYCVASPFERVVGGREFISQLGEFVSQCRNAVGFFDSKSLEPGEAERDFG